MAFNPSPKVAAARDVGQQFNKKQVIVLMIDDDTLELVTWGQTKALCAEAKATGDVAYDAVMNLMISEMPVSNNRTLYSPLVAKRLIAIRDAILEKDWHETYHQLYQIADPGFQKLDGDEVWPEMEALAAQCEIDID